MRDTFGTAFERTHMTSYDPPADLQALDALEMKLEGQKSYARSKYGEVYGLFDTARCFYIFVKGRAYYILPKDAVAGGEAEELQKFLQKKCRKHFQHFDLTEGKGECV